MYSLTVICVTYNHVEYIARAIDSMCSQKTNFEYQIFVFDDCSTDGTSEIVRSYIKQNPNITLFSNEKNIGAERNFIKAISHIDTEYVALCDGDDYWTDNNKLQKQIDALSENINSTVCFHEVEIVDKNGIKHGVFPDKNIDFEEVENLVLGNFIQTNSVVYRWRKGAPDILSENAVPLDWLLHLYHAEIGTIIFLPENMAAYRKHSRGVWTSSSDVTRHRKIYGARQLRFFEILSGMFSGLYRDHCVKAQRDIFSTVMFSACYESDFSAVKECLRYNIDYVINYFIRLNIPLDKINPKDIENAVFDVLAVTVIVTTYNHERFIEKCLNSIFTQKGIRLNVILGDDSSSDRTVQIAKEVSEKYTASIMFIERKLNVGMLENMRQCIDSASKDYIAFCEGDDYWISDRRLLKHVLAMAGDEEIGLSFNWILVDDEIDHCNYPHGAQALLENMAFVDKWQLVQENFIGNFSACVYRTRALKEISAKYWEKQGAADWLLNLLISFHHRIIFIKDILSVYRLHPSGQWSAMSKEDKMEIIRLSRIDYCKFIGFDYDAMCKFLKSNYELKSSKNVPDNIRFYVEEITPMVGSVKRGFFLVKMAGWIFSDTPDEINLVVSGNNFQETWPLSIERMDVVRHFGLFGSALCSSLLCGFAVYINSSVMPCDIKISRNGIDSDLGTLRIIPQDASSK